MLSSWKKELKATSCPPSNAGGKYAIFVSSLATAILLAAWAQLNSRINDFDCRMRSVELSNAAICAHLNITTKGQASPTTGQGTAKDSTNPANSQLYP